MTFGPETNYFESPDYQRFVADMAKHCRCTHNRPCDGVLAGGMCDGVIDDDDDFEWNDSDDDYDD